VFQIQQTIHQIQVALVLYKNEIALTILGITALIGIVICIACILRNPFKYPYYVHYFDVSRRRNVDMEDLIDDFLLDETNVIELFNHQYRILCWQREADVRVATSPLRRLRRRQLEKRLDHDRAYTFVTTRDQTRYTQRNYVKKPYTVIMQDDAWTMNWEWIQARIDQLRLIGFETTLKKYHSKNQRRLMTRALREQIMERDDYTCQICGKYMPDQVGLQIDHIIPVSKGGKTVPSNLQVLCSRCNGRKGDR
jgi:5-methylcytosine-specific restriction endonuclease McrA